MVYTAEGESPLFGQDVKSWETEFTLGTWSSNRGAKQALEVSARIIELLHENTGLSVSGFHVVDVQLQSSLLVRPESQALYFVRARFAADLQPLTSKAG